MVAHIYIICNLFHIFLKKLWDIIFLSSGCFCILVLELFQCGVLYAIICSVKLKMVMAEIAELYVALQSGHNIEKVREKMRELTKQIVNIYSASKSFPYILEGLRSKNNRTRIECVDLVGFIIDHHGVEVKVVNFVLLLMSVVIQLF